MYVIVVYDISSEKDGAWVQKQVYKLCKKFLHHVQGSVFEGELRLSQYKTLEDGLNSFIRDTIDSVIIYKIQNENWIERTLLTKVEDKTDNYI